jgi:hypothetical protein
MAFGNDYGVRPDATELRVRFVCGALVGSLLGAAWSFRVNTPWQAAVLLTLAGGLGSGLMARYFGDRFWSSLWSRWPR